MPIKFHRPDRFKAPPDTPDANLNPVQKLFRKDKDRLTGENRQTYDQLQAIDRLTRSTIFGSWITKSDAETAQSADFLLRAQSASAAGTSVKSLRKLAADPDPNVRIAVANNTGASAAILTQLATDPDANVRGAVAGNPGTSPADLTNLAGETLVAIRRAVALNPGTPLDVLRRLKADVAQSVSRAAWMNLASNANVNIRLEVARDRRAPNNVLTGLAGDATVPVRREVARNPGAVLDVLARLTRDADPSVSQAAWLNLGTNENIERLKANVEMCRELMRHPATPATIFEKLSTAPDSSVRKAVAGNPNAPDRILMTLAKDRDSSVCKAALTTLAASPDMYVRRNVAANLKTPLEALKALAQDGYLSVRTIALTTMAWNEDGNIRAEVADHPETPVKTLKRLTGDEVEKVSTTAWKNLAKNEDAQERKLAWAALVTNKDPMVRFEVAGNASAPVETLRKLTDDKIGEIREKAWETLAENPDINIRRNVANDPDAFPSALDKLTRDANEEISQAAWMTLATNRLPVARKATARNPNAPLQILEMLANSPEADIRATVADNRSAPEHILTKLAEDESIDVQKGVARNRNTPLSILEEFAESKDWSMRAAVAQNESASEKILEKLVADMEPRVRKFTPALYRYSYLLSKHTGMGMKEIREKILKEIDQSQMNSEATLSQFAYGELNRKSGNFNRVANPFVNAMLPQDESLDTVSILKKSGASRSIMNPEEIVNSLLLDRFVKNYDKISEASYGLEHEMFVPGLSDMEEEKISELAKRLGAEKYQFVYDDSLKIEANIALAIEMVTDVLHSPEDVRKLQNILSILNDYGAFSNDTSGVHIHIGIDQWKSDLILKSDLEKAANPHLKKWDSPSNDPGDPTPLQLLFMKQFSINMGAIEKDFYKVSKESKHNKKNKDYSSLDAYCEKVSRANNLQKLHAAIQINESNLEDEDAERYRNYCVNIGAYKKHKTIEIRGFSKDGRDSMLVDPNIPIRDMLLLQELKIKTIESVKDILMSGASPDDVLNNTTLAPSDGLNEGIGGYVQDTLWYQCVHAVGQRNSGLRLQSMNSLMEKKALINPETLEKIKSSRDVLLGEDEAADRFIDCLSGKAEWDSESMLESMKKGEGVARKSSLREAANVNPN